MKYLFVSILCSLLPLVSFSQNDDIVPKGSRSPMSDLLEKKGEKTTRDNIIMLSIAIDDFVPGEFGHLECTYNAKKFIEPLEASFTNNYRNTSFVHSYDDASNNSEQIQELLKKWKEKAVNNNPNKNIAVLYLSSHGYLSGDSTYFFVTSNSRKDKIRSTAISSNEIIQYVKYLTDAGVLVIVFVDTCHGEALYKEHIKNDFNIKNDKGGVAFFAASSSNNSAYIVNQNSLFTASIGYCLSGQDVSSISDNGFILLSSLESFIKRDISNKTSNINYKNQNPQTFLSRNCQNFVILKECKPFAYHLRLSDFNPFAKVPDLSQYSRFAQSNAKARTYSTILHGVEIVSLATVVTSVGIILNQQSKINDLDSRGLNSNSNRKTARTACYCLYGSAAMLALAYGFQVVNIHHQFKRKHIVDTFESIEKGFKDNYVSTISLGPVVGNDYLGLGLTYNF